MIQKIKYLLYFSLANYFAFFAKIRLKRWKPRIFAVTGSSGKTTLLHLIQSQLGGRAKYSFKANSSFGIPFDILGLHRETLTLGEWPKLFVLTPFRAFKEPPNEKIYVVEVDCDRPGEGKFLGELLRPEVTLWISSSKTHSMNFDRLIEKRIFPSVEESIAHEFGNFVITTQKLLIVNADYPVIKKQLARVKIKIKEVSYKGLLKKYLVSKKETEFQIGSKKYTFQYLLPKETCASILMVLELLDYLGVKPDPTFKNFKLPPGRSSVFRGVKGTTIVDSTYNANFDSMSVVLHAFGEIEAESKWVVLGDMLEQGKAEKEEHEKLAELIEEHKFDRIILMGPRISEYTYPKLRNLENRGVKVVKFLGPREVLDYLEEEIEGGETILFKGARFLDGVIEHLLIDKRDVAKLPRREKVWDTRRRKWGL